MRKRCWRRPEPMADAVITTLGEAASTVLLTADPHAKVMAARAAARNWRLGRLAHVFDTVLPDRPARPDSSEEHTSELQSLMRNSYAVFLLKKKTTEQQIGQ